MIELLEFMFRSFWTFLGCGLLLSGAMHGILFIYNRFWKHWNIRKHGYPPAHCDADGDFRNDLN